MIKNPISIEQLEERSSSYKSLDELQADFKLMVDNAKQYNQEGSDIWLDSIELYGVFQKGLAAAQAAVGEPSVHPEKPITMSFKMGGKRQRKDKPKAAAHASASKRVPQSEGSLGEVRSKKRGKKEKADGPADELVLSLRLGGKKRLRESSDNKSPMWVTALHAMCTPSTCTARCSLSAVYLLGIQRMVTNAHSQENRFSVPPPSAFRPTFHAAAEKPCRQVMKKLAAALDDDREPLCQVRTDAYSLI